MNTAFYPIFTHLVRGPWGAGICFILFGVACTHAQSSERLTRPEIFLDPQVRSCGVSGQSSVTTVTLPNPGTTKRGVYGFTLGERRDHPCFIRVHRESISNHGTDFSRAADRCGDKGPTKRLPAFVGWNDNQLYEWRDSAGGSAGSAARSYFVRVVEVCMMNDRLKGLRVFSTKVSGDGTIAIPSKAPCVYIEPPEAGLSGLLDVVAAFLWSGRPPQRALELLCRKVRRRIARRLDPNAPLPGKNPRK